VMLRGLCIDTVEEDSVVSSRSCSEAQGLSAEKLKSAVKDGDAEQVAMLLQSKAEANACYVHGLTALHFAAIRNHPEVARVLLEAGADLKATTTDEASLTPVDIALHQGFSELMAVLVGELDAYRHSAGCGRLGACGRSEGRPT